MTILVSNLPSQHNIDRLKAAALELTNAKNSVSVKTNHTEDNYALITDFKMRTTAQYKAVGDIDKAFKFQTWDFEHYQDMIIQFPDKFES
ncbi:MAG: hypothetical protein AAGC54_12740 [Cyanobacteria bacterium P01_F01_bin.4]